MQTLHISNLEIHREDDRLTLRMSKQQSLMTLIFFSIWLISCIQGLFFGIMHHKILTIVLCLLFGLIDLLFIWVSVMSLRDVCLLDRQTGKLSQAHGSGRDLSTISAIMIKKSTGTYQLNFHFASGPKLSVLSGRASFKYLAEAECCAQEISEFLHVPITHDDKTTAISTPS